MTHYRSMRCYESHATEQKTTNLARSPGEPTSELLKTRPRLLDREDPFENGYREPETQGFGSI